MKQIVRFLFLFIFVISACVPGVAPSSNVEYTLRHALHSTVSIQLFNPETAEWRVVGAGTVVRQENAFYLGDRPKYAVLTAEHIMSTIGDREAKACSDIAVEACMPFLSGWRGGGTDPRTLDGDWAIVPIYSTPYGVRPIRVRKEPSRVGEPVYFVGYPWGNFLISNGISSGYKIKGDTRIDRSYGFIAPGNSGGAVLDEEGRLIGIVVGMPIERGPDSFPTYQHDIVLSVSVSSVIWELPAE